MTEYRPGEIVDILIKGVRIAEQDQHGCVTITAKDCFDGKHASWRVPPQAAVTRVASADWPPRAGDVWHDRNEAAWFAFTALNGPEILMIPGDSKRDPLTTPPPHVVLDAVGPMTLVYREGGSADA
ncbi:hypothetical protein [Actinomadura litoris]|uniref:Uncharacterized protein n=1 Tax=Actinomadura litoris TaxID=2678616 RepID=A0A7K1LB61_9ACTN|nr:hypothetical protein [Actinomadura litoris]MUN41486.1 hypothetical protein [Actinomadura litoris]